MNDFLGQQIQTSLLSLKTLRGQAENLNDQQQSQLLENFKEYSRILEKLEIAIEALGQHNAMLTTTRASLEVERDRYQELFELAPEGYLVTDRQGMILEANRAAERLLNCSGKRLAGKSLIHFVPLPAQPVFQNQLNQLQCGNAVKNWESQIQPQWGSVFPTLLTVSAVQDSQHQVVGFRWMLRDISELKPLEEARQESDSQFHRMVDTVPVMIWMCRIDKRCTYFNQGWLDFTGHTLQQEIGNSWIENVHPDDREHCFKTYNNAFDAREKFTMEYRLRRFDGEYRWILDTGVPRFTTAGEFAGYIGSCIDITDRIQTQEALQQSLKFDAMLKRITDNIRDRLDESAILQTAVSELTQVLGIEGCNTALYDTQQNTSTISYEYVPRLPTAKGYVVQMADFSAIYRQLLRGEHFQFCELVPSHYGLVTMLACPIFDDRGVLGDLWLFKPRNDVFNEFEIQLVQQVASQCAIAIRQARLYQRAQAQVHELEKLNHLKDDFLSTVPHELRTPITNMKMAIEMLYLMLDKDKALSVELRKPQSQQSRLARYFQILKNECDREFRLVNDLLDLQRLHADVQTLVLTSIRLQDWLPQIVAPFQARAKNRQQTLQMNLPSNLPCLISEPSSLGRIVGELLNNACKYTPAGERITITAQAGAGMMQLSVRNSGVEISQQALPHIFDKFYRAPSTDPWKEGGTGLGLTLVQQLVTHLGGTIEVESTSGQTCFTVKLPLGTHTNSL